MSQVRNPKARPRQALSQDSSLEHTAVIPAVVDKALHSDQQSQEALRWLAAIVQSSDDAIIGKSLNGVITSWNPGAEVIFGHTEAEAVGQSIALIIPPNLLDEEARILERLRSGERIRHFQTVRLRKDGSSGDVSLTI